MTHGLFTVLCTAALGALSWSFAEYALHHWNGHLMKGKTLFSREHLKHHADPRYFAPTSMKIRMATPVLLGVTAFSVWVAGALLGIVFCASFTLTYIAYEVLHRRTHTHPPRHAYGRWARKHHLAHHFTNPKENHGVTSPIWDIVFRTLTPIDRVRVPERLATLWLLEDGEIKEPYREDYVLARPASRRRVVEETPLPPPDSEADRQAAYASLAPQ